MILQTVAPTDKAVLSLDGVVASTRFGEVRRDKMLAAASRPASPPSTLILAPQSAPRCFRTHVATGLGVMERWQGRTAKVPIP